MRRAQMVTGMPAAMIAAGLLFGACSSGNGESSNDDTESTRRATKAPSAESDYQLMNIEADVALDPGRWALTAAGPAGPPLAVVEVPTGLFGAGSFIHGGPEPGGVLGYWPATGGAYRDPCTKAGPVRGGGSVRGLARALAAQDLTKPARPVPVSLDGQDGFYLELTMPSDFSYDSCRGKVIRLWDGPAPYSDFPGSLRLWIVDVEGDAVALSALTEAPADDDAMRTFTELVESVEFVQP